MGKTNKKTRKKKKLTCKQKVKRLTFIVYTLIIIIIFLLLTLVYVIKISKQTIKNSTTSYTNTEQTQKTIPSDIDYEDYTIENKITIDKDKKSLKSIYEIKTLTDEINFFKT